MDMDFRQLEPLAAADFLLLSACVLRRGGVAPPETVPFVDLEGYAGTRYGIVRLPNSNLVARSATQG